MPTPSSYYCFQDLDIEDRILRRREMTHLFQWYYPEGGWGWVILFCSFVSLSLAQGLQWGFSFPMGAHVRKRFSAQPSNNSDVIGGGSIGDAKGVGTFEIGELAFIEVSCASNSWHHKSSFNEGTKIVKSDLT